MRYYLDNGCFGRDSHCVDEHPYDVSLEISSVFFRSSSIMPNESSRILFPIQVIPEGFCAEETSSIGMLAECFSSACTTLFSSSPTLSSRSSKDWIIVLKRHAFLSSPN